MGRHVDGNGATLASIIWVVSRTSRPWRLLKGLSAPFADFSLSIRSPCLPPFKTRLPNPKNRDSQTPAVSIRVVVCMACSSPPLFPKFNTEAMRPSPLRPVRPTANLSLRTTTPSQ
ncbi:hypothetical protein VTJ04DRAFT_203 [Mycothermus thermophilus]|uniref:uncharacterized protein n=1 Tax=Humicola insolens TaxID=85995 RepID=UPI00374356D3